MGRKSRDKGAEFERLVAKKFSNVFGIEYRRTPLSGGWARGSKTAAGDLVPLDSQQLFCVECKKVEGWSLSTLFSESHALFSSWWLQLLGECPDGIVPVLVFSKNREQVYAVVDYIDKIFPSISINENSRCLTVMLLDDWLALAKQLFIVEE